MWLWFAFAHVSRRLSTFLYIFEEASLEITCPFLSWIVFLLLSLKYSLYVLDLSPLLEIGFANISSHAVSCLPNFSTVGGEIQFIYF